MIRMMITKVLHMNLTTKVKKSKLLIITELLKSPESHVNYLPFHKILNYLPQYLLRYYTHTEPQKLHLLERKGYQSASNRSKVLLN